MNRNENPLFIFKNKEKRLQIQKELQLHQLIEKTIGINTFKNKSNTFKFDKLNQLLKSHSLYDSLVTDSNRNLLNKMPYLLFGIVESIFVDEEKSEKTKEYGCGILIDSSVVLLPAKNLIFDNASFTQGEDGNDQEQEHENNNEDSKANSKSKSKHKSDFHFKLFEIEFKPLNLAPEYRSYLPKSIKVIDHYTPLISEEEKSDEEKLKNGWGLAYLEYPIGDFLNFIIEKDKEKDRNKYKSKASNGKSTDPISIMDNVSVKPLGNSELEQAEIHFLECFPKDNQAETLNNMENDVEVTSIYDFHESIYDMNFDTNLIYLNNPYQNQKIEEEVLPGFIIGTYMRKYYLVGMNTNTMIKFSINEEMNNNNNNNNNNRDSVNRSKTDSLEVIKNSNQNTSNTPNLINDIGNNNNNNNNMINESNEQQMADSHSPIYHIAIRFTKELAEHINQKVIEFNEQYPNQCNFNVKIFDEFNKSIRSKSDLILLLKNNCNNLYTLLNKIKDNKSITSNDKQVLNFEYGMNMKFIQFAFMLLWNKYTSSIIESKIIDIENISCGFFPGSDIISEIIQSKESLMTLNLKNNELFSNGIKSIMQPIFNKKKILDIGKELKCLCLDSNKLDGKSLKYIRYLIKVSPQLGLLSLSNNYISGSSLRHLLNATKGKDSLEMLYLNFNMIGNKAGPYLEVILSNLSNLRELNLSSNVLGDASVPFIESALKKNDKLETLILSNNEFTELSAESIASLLSNNKSLKMLWLNNNDFKAEGIKIISQALSTKLVLEEINLNSTNASDAGGAELFENMKMNRSIKRLFINCNGLKNKSMEKFGELLKMDNEDENRQGIEMISLSGNYIDDECVNFFVEEIMQHRNIKEIKLNSNFITDEAGEFLLYAALQNPSITKINLENNQTTWMVNNSNFKSIRSDIQIFF